MLRSIICVLFAALMIVPAAAFAETHTHAGAGIDIWFPDGWAIEAEEDMISATAKDESMIVIAGVLEVGEVDAAVDALTAELEGFMTDIKTDGDAEEFDVNGLKGSGIDGTAKVEGTEVEFSVGFIASPTGKVLMILAFAEKGGFDKNEKSVEKILKGLKPAN